MRSKSGMLVAPERTMSAALMTNIAEAVRDIFCSVLDAEVTFVFMRSSRLKLVRSGEVVCGQAGMSRKKSIVNRPSKRPARTSPMFQARPDLRLIIPVVLRKEVLRGACLGDASSPGRCDHTVLFGRA